MNAPRLTAARLDDLDEAIKCLDETIEYLEKAIPTYPKESDTRIRLVTKYNKLLNGRNFIADLITKGRSK